MAPPPGASLMAGPPPTAGGVDSAPPPLLGGSIPKGAIIAGVAMVVVLVGILAFFGSQSRDADVATQSTAPAAGGISFRVREEDKPYIPPGTERWPEGSGGWIIFSPDDKTFSVEMPKQPNNLKLYTFEVKGNDVQTLLFNNANANGGYTLSVAEIGEIEGDVQQELRSYATDYAKAVGGRAEAGRVADHYGNPARDFVLTAPGFQLNARAVRNGTRVYVLAAGGTDPTAYNWEHFRNSFNPVAMSER